MSSQFFREVLRIELPKGYLKFLYATLRFHQRDSVISYWSFLKKAQDHIQGPWAPVCTGALEKSDL